eukprot:9280026-Pyramimonas_sp.AAC.1
MTNIQRPSARSATVPGLSANLGGPFGQPPRPPRHSDKGLAKNLGAGPDAIIGHIGGARPAIDGPEASDGDARGSRERPRAPLTCGPDP